MGLRKSPDFRPDSKRAVFVTGEINQSLADRLTPEILKLLDSSDEPLTVFRDSPGGATFFAEGIYRTIKTCSQDLTESRRIITVALNMAASAACDMLIAGDFAIVQPHTIVLCHGVRQTAEGAMVTREVATDLAKTLASSNEQYALQMASNAISRFIFRFAMLRVTFDAIRERIQDPDHSDLSCFLLAIQDYTSPRLTLLLSQAMINYLDNDMLDADVMNRYNAEDPTPEGDSQFAAFLLKCIIDYEVKNSTSKPNWSFRNDGLPKLEEKFAILINTHEEAHKAQIAKLVSRWGEFLLSGQDSAEYALVSADEKEAWLDQRVTRTIRSLWFLFVAICRLLQQNENYLTAEEAYWIGLVDEILGRPNLPSPRVFVEYTPDPEDTSDVTPA